MSSQSHDKRLMPILLLLFVGSGCAALIYEIVWFQLLELVIGSSAISMGVLLGTFMGGMCLGSLLLPRVISPEIHPLKVYGLLEAGIGIIGVLVLIGVPLAGSLYTSFVGHGLTSIFLRAGICALCLIPPTLMMGATLPAISRWVETSRDGISWLGYFYGGNIAGAVFGCLLAGFYLLRVYDMVTATFVAAGINAAVAIFALRLSSRTPARLPTTTPSTEPSQSAEPVSGTRLAYVTIALSGLAALGAEAVWTRQLSLVFGATVYAFSIILAVFLFGLGLGSAAGSYLIRVVQHPRLLLGLCQILVTGAIAWAAWTIANSLPTWPIDPQLINNPWHAFRVDIERCLWAVLPAAFLWGASFPLALASVPSGDKDPGRLVGGVYAANTVGAIIGGLAFSTLVVPSVGSQRAQQILIAISAVAAVSILMHRKAVIVAGLIVAVAVSSVVPPIPGLLVAYGRDFATWIQSPPEVRYVGEGMNSSVAVTEWPSGVRNFHVAGKIEASSAHRDMRLERMLGHLSALMHPQPKSVLIVGFGAGVTAGSFVLHPSIERIVICEIEPLIPEVVSTYFSSQNYNVLSDPRVEVVYDDARHYILTTREKFDIITSDPIHPWVKGAATLYTTEYFENVKAHLNPGGVATQWVPLYDSTEDVVQSEFATFFQTYPYGTVWNSDIREKGYDTVLIGYDGPTKIDIDAFTQRLLRPDHLVVMKSLQEVGFTTPLSILYTYAGWAPDMQPWLRTAEINTDRNLRLQYLAGLVVNFTDADRIYQNFLRYRRIPDDVFAGSAALREDLRQALLPLP